LQPQSAAWREQLVAFAQLFCRIMNVLNDMAESDVLKLTPLEAKVAESGHPGFAASRRGRSHSRRVDVDSLRLPAQRRCADQELAIAAPNVEQPSVAACGWIRQVPSISDIKVLLQSREKPRQQVPGEY